MSQHGYKVSKLSRTLCGKSLDPLEDAYIILNDSVYCTEACKDYGEKCHKPLSSSIVTSSQNFNAAPDSIPTHRCSNLDLRALKMRL